MAQWTCKTEGDFAAAHFLTHYHGKCERLHGHNYRVIVRCRGTKLDEGGMLLDFSVLKSSLRTVLSKIDHINLNDMEVFKDDPSAERIAGYIFGQMEEEFKNYSIDTALLHSVDVYETPLNMARYER